MQEQKQQRAENCNEAQRQEHEHQKSAERNTIAENLNECRWKSWQLKIERAFSVIFLIALAESYRTFIGKRCAESSCISLTNQWIWKT